MPPEDAFVKALTIYGFDIIAHYRQSNFIDFYDNTIYVEDEILSYREIEKNV